MLYPPIDFISATFFLFVNLAILPEIYKNFQHLSNILVAFLVLICFGILSSFILQAMMVLMVRVDFEIVTDRQYPCTANNNNHNGLIIFFVKIYLFITQYDMKLSLCESESDELRYANL